MAAELHWSGYGNVHWMDMSGAPDLTTRDLDDSVLQLREFSLFLDVAVTDKLTVSAEFEASSSGEDYGINYGYLLYDVNEWFSFKAGKILVPFLKYNEEKPNFKQNLMSPPFTASILAPVVNPNTQIASGIGWSDVGGVLEGRWTTESSVTVVNLAVINGLSSEDVSLDSNTVEFADGTPNQPVRPRNGLIENEATHLDVNDDKALVGRVLWQSTDIPLSFGVSLYHGAWDRAGDYDLSMFGLNFEYRADRWEVKGEWALADVEQEAGLLPPGNTLGPNTTTGDYNMDALWIETAWRFYEYGDGKFVKGVLRYDDANPNDEAMFTPFRRKRATVGLEWQFSGHTRMRYEYQSNEIQDFEMAPGMVADSMDEEPTMHMVSFVFWF